MNECPSIRPDPYGSQTLDLPKGQYGVPDIMVHGYQNVRSATAPLHPLQHSEKQWEENKMKMDFAMLRKNQGISAPLQLQMEMNVAKKMQRLPGLPSSDIMYDTLTGRDEMIQFEDILNCPSESEMMGQPHAIMEKRLGIL